MGIFTRKTPLQKEWEALTKKELKLLESRKEKKDNVLNQKLAAHVPEKLQQTLDTAFSKAFALIFEKGTAVIEKTYSRGEHEKKHQINRFVDETRQTRKSLRAFSKQASTSSNVNVLLSSVSGIGMGALGIGIPDIPIFTAMILKAIYEIALSYGFEYESEEEQYFILSLIQGAVSYGDDMYRIDTALNQYITASAFPIDYSLENHIQETAALLSKELLYMKFLQGIPVVGAIGGIYDTVYMTRITEYAKLKYQKRFLIAKKGEGR